MTKDELKIWFWEKFYSCYPVEHQNYPGNVILMYDEAFIRDIKLSNILNEEVKYPEKVTGQWLFYLDYKSGYLEVNYKEIWSFLEQNYSTNYLKIIDLIKGLLEEHDKMKALTPWYFGDGSDTALEEHDKMKALTPNWKSRSFRNQLEEHDKMKALTPDIPVGNLKAMLEEHDKMKALTPSIPFTIVSYLLEEHDKMKIL